MAEGEPRDDLLCELDADTAYATGERPFPRPLRTDDAAAVVASLHRQIDVGVEARARAADRAGYHIACAPGCNACCSELIMVTLPEATLVARWLAGHPEERAAFLEAHGRWRWAVGDAPEQLIALIASGDEAEYMRLYIEQFQRGISCAFNRDGLCSIYPVRPAVCRVAHALDTAEHCRGDSPAGPLPARLSFVPLDQLVSRSRSVMLAAHHAMGAPADTPVALCDAVYRLLADLAAPGAMESTQMS